MFTSAKGFSFLSNIINYQHFLFFLDEQCQYISSKKIPSGYGLSSHICIIHIFFLHLTYLICGYDHSFLCFSMIIVIRDRDNTRNSFIYLFHL